MKRIRVISGVARGRKLHMVPGESTRPIQDRVKEALFNILGTDIYASTFLDMFAGTGSVGIEALSRGAEFVRFIDSNRRAIQTIKKNLELTSLGSNADVVQGNAFSLLSQPADRLFDIIFIAPPQYKELWVRSLSTLNENLGWLKDEGWIVVQIDPREYKENEFNHLEEFDRRRYGNTILLFLRKK